MKTNILTRSSFLGVMFFSSFALINHTQAEIYNTVIATGPTAFPDVATTTEGKPVSMTVWNNDLSVSAMLDPQMVKLFDPVTGLRSFFVAIPNEGSFAVNFLTGVVTFTPVAGFVGVSTINYDIQDLNGEFSNQAAITVTVTTNPLPVTLSSFHVTREGTIARLNWATTEETNSDHFEIQHSLTGKDWNKIGTVDSHGDSKVRNVYSFNDTNPASGGLSNGENLYRLKMIDKDQTFAYSRIQSVKFEGLTSLLVSTYPNPSADRVFIKDADLNSIKLASIIDMNGRTVFNTNKVDSNGINLSSLAQGTYILHITSLNGLSSSHKIMVVR